MIKRACCLYAGSFISALVYFCQALSHRGGDSHLVSRQSMALYVMQPCLAGASRLMDPIRNGEPTSMPTCNHSQRNKHSGHGTISEKMMKAGMPDVRIA